MRKYSAFVILGLLVAARVSAQPSSVEIDRPSDRAIVSASFTMRGVARGADVIHVWAWPSTPGAAPVFLGATAANKPDPDRGLSSGAFVLNVVNAPLGRSSIVVYAHDLASNTFPAQNGIVATVRPDPFIISGFGDSGSPVLGDDESFVVTHGKSGSQGGLVQFGRPYDVPPICIASTETVSENPVIVRTFRESVWIVFANLNPGNQTQTSVLCRPADK